MTFRRLPLALAMTALCAGTAHAAPFSPFDVRAAGMGGTGVASAKAASAALFNPAMLSAQKEGDAFQFVLGVGATAADEAEMFDTVDELQILIDDFDAAIGASDDLGAYNAAVDIRKSLADIDGNYLIADLGTGLGVGVPSRKLGVGVFVSVKAQALVSPTVASSDYTFIDGVIADYEDNNAIDTPPGTFPGNSQVTGVAIAVAEYGVALSHRLAMGEGSLDIGVTPKAVEISTFDYTETIDNFDDADIDSGTYEKTDSGFDLDAGVVYKPNAESNWQYALVAKNLVGGDYKTVTNRSIELNTQLRAGVAHVKDRTTLAVDLDLTENDGVAPGTETQFLALGAEYDLKYLQGRIGYRANLASSNVDDVASIGLGLGPVDLSVMGNADEVGAYLQIGFGW